MEKQIYQAMAIPPELIVERGKTWKNSQTLRPSITLEFKHAQTDIIEQLQRVFETPYDRFKREFVTLLRDMGLHTDNVDKVRYVLDCSEGFDFLKTLSLTQMQDTEWLIQRLLDIYVDVTS